MALGQTIGDRIALSLEKNDVHGCFKCIKWSIVYIRATQSNTGSIHLLEMHIYPPPDLPELESWELAQESMFCLVSEGCLFE